MDKKGKEKLLKAKDKLLLAAALVEDFFSLVQDPAGIVSLSYETLYGFTPPRYKFRNLHQAVYRLLKTGEMERKIKDGEPYLVLTNAGKRKIIREFPLLRLQRRKWDRKWRWVYFDIPEKKAFLRRIFREKLKELKLGMAQKSVYVTPYPFASDLQEFVETRGLASFVYITVSDHFLVGDEKRFAFKVWKLGKLEKMYKELLEKWRGRRRKNLEHLKREIKSSYLEVLSEDPLLPKELLPEDWVGFKVRELVASLMRK